jgi:uncharacterized protein YrrD
MKSQDLKGMPILTLQEGERLGQVRSLIVDPSTIQIVALVLGKRTPGGEVQVVATANIHTVGQTAITVESRSSMVPLSRIPRFQELSEAKTHVRNKMVVTESGTELGRVSEMIVNPETFQIEAILLKKLLGEGQRIGAEQIRTIGPDAIMVHETPVQPRPLRSTLVSPKEAPAETDLPVETTPEALPEEEASATGLDSPVLGQILAQEEQTIEEDSEPAIPPISTLDEMMPPAIIETIPPEEAALSFGEGDAPPIEEAEVAQPIDLEVAPEEKVPPEAEEEEPENPWQRWVRRLRRQEGEDEP